ncbi:DUF3352 domain-containing protein [Salibacter halophilus]|uniref:DUF3352 domain-containing protein n=1 Tax=Salibacter halophilus TaxID=1803916 RepID=A0A6N6M1V6_9FLAO|nr:DUF3352 domain-containing protein [Salibacter halophilus]KAB1062138.1 DUF3352 domain-containing protein [Salibacter halophilus]
MVKRIILYVFIALMIGALVWVFLDLRQANKPVKSALYAIPQSSSVVIENDNPFETWNRIANKTVIWEEFKSLDGFQYADSSLFHLDTLLKKDENWESLLRDEKTYLVFNHTDNGAEWGWLMKFPANYDYTELEGVLTESLEAKKDSAGAYSISIHEKNFFVRFKEQMVVVSPTEKFISKSLETLKTGKSLASDSLFQEVYKTAGSTRHGHVFVNYQNISAIGQNLIKAGDEEVFKTVTNHFAEWSVMDISMKSNEVMLNGFTNLDPLDNQFLGTFSNQSPHDHDAAKILPENTASFIHFGFSNYLNWYEHYRQWLEKTSQLYSHDSLIKELEVNYKLTLEKDILPWIEHESVLGYLDDETLNHKDRYFAVVKTSNEVLASKKLKSVSIESAEPRSYRDYEIHQLKTGKQFSLAFGRHFKAIEKPFYTIIDRFVILANDERTLVKIINDYLAGEPLIKKESFAEFNESVSEESNVFLYCNPAASANLLMSFGSDRLDKFIAKNKTFIKKFQAISLQWSRESDNLFYQNAYLLHNPVYKEEVHSLWELALDTTTSMKPAVVKNHYTGANEIFIQDDNNKVYLISNTGKVLWERQIDGQIISEIEQIDVYQNDKLQMIFNTDEAVYLLDRLGNDVESFPVKIAGGASAPITVLDYDNDGDHRILVPTKTGDLLNLSNRGEPVKGWAFEKQESAIKSQVLYTVIKRKDYLITVNEKGHVYGHSRRGNVRLEMEEVLPVHNNSNFYLHSNSSLESSYLSTADSFGLVHNLLLDDRLIKKEFGDIHTPNIYLHADINMDNKPDFILADSSGVRAWSDDDDELLNYELDNVTPTSLNNYQFQNTSAVGVSFRSKDEILLIDRTGKLWPHFPLRGGMPFSISDLNDDGSYNLIVADKNGILYTYLLDDKM